MLSRQRKRKRSALDDTEEEESGEEEQEEEEPSSEVILDIIRSARQKNGDDVGWKKMAKTVTVITLP